MMRSLSCVAEMLVFPNKHANQLTRAHLGLKLQSLVLQDPERTSSYSGYMLPAIWFEYELDKMPILTYCTFKGLRTKSAATTADSEKNRQL